MVERVFLGYTHTVPCYKKDASHAGDKIIVGSLVQEMMIIETRPLS